MLTDKGIYTAANLPLKPANNPPAQFNPLAGKII